MQGKRKKFVRKPLEEGEMNQIRRLKCFSRKYWALIAMLWNANINGAEMKEVTAAGYNSNHFSQINKLLARNGVKIAVRAIQHPKKGLHRGYYAFRRVR